MFQNRTHKCKRCLGEKTKHNVKFIRNKCLRARIVIMFEKHAHMIIIWTPVDYGLPSSPLHPLMLLRTKCSMPLRTKCMRLPCCMAPENERQTGTRREEDLRLGRKANRPGALNTELLPQSKRNRCTEHRTTAHHFKSLGVGLCQGHDLCLHCFRHRVPIAVLLNVLHDGVHDSGSLFIIFEFPHACLGETEESNDLRTLNVHLLDLAKIFCPYTFAIDGGGLPDHRHLLTQDLELVRLREKPDLPADAYSITLLTATLSGRQ